MYFLWSFVFSVIICIYVYVMNNIFMHFSLLHVFVYRRKFTATKTTVCQR